MKPGRGAGPRGAASNRSTGRYSCKKNFTVSISKPGFQTQVIPITASANGWYIAGNFIFGGLIGWFAVDPFSGSMYTLSPEAVAATLPADKAAHNNQATDGSISIVLLQDVPSHLRDKLVRVQ